MSNFYNRFPHLKNIKVFILEIAFLLLIYIGYILIFQVLTPSYYFCQILKFLKYMEFVYCGDFSDYSESISNLNVLFSQNYTYQSRPLLMMITSIFYNFFSIFELNLIDKTILSYLTFNYLFLTIEYFFVKKLLLFYKFNLSIKKLVLIQAMLILNPVMKFSITEITIQQGTFLIFLISLIYLNLENLKYVLFLGIIYLYNGSSIFFIFLLIYELFKNKKLYTFIYKLFIFFSPYIIYRGIFVLKKYDFYDANTEYWGQFYWLNRYIYGLINLIIDFLNLNISNLEVKYYSGEWYCTEITTFFTCYIKDINQTVSYLSIFVIIFIFIFKSEIQIDKNLYIVFTAYLFFWSLIGWYPPIRFSLYPINSLFVFLVIIYIGTNNLNLQKSINLMIILIYLINLNNWNVFYYDSIKFIFNLKFIEIYFWTALLLNNLRGVMSKITYVSRNFFK